LRSEKEHYLWFTMDIFEYYGDSLLFRIFLYPYIDKKTVLTLGFAMSNFYNYLRECCTAVDEVPKMIRREPLKKYRYFWNKDSEKYNKKILKHLQEVFDIEKVNYEDIIIEKIEGGNKLQILHPQFHIIIRLDRERKRAIAEYSELNKLYEYEIDDSGKDTLLLSRETLEELAKYVFGTRMLVERLVFEIIFSLAKSRKRENEETLENLSSDQKFMRLINDFHNTLEEGYNTIIKSK
jgi:hypothetical protein